MAKKKSRIERKKRTPLDDEKMMIGPALSFSAKESYKVLRTNLMFSLPDEDGCKVIGVTSSIMGEGKSTTSINLAYTMAQTGMRVLLLEADMRLGNDAKRLGLEVSPGLSNLLAGMTREENVIQESGLNEDLFVVAAGDIPPNPAELLGSGKMVTALEHMKERFDVIIIDLPPVQAVSDAAVIARLIDGMIVVTRQNYCTRGVLSDTIRQLEFLEIKILGFVMTDAEVHEKGFGKYKKYER